LRESRVEDIVPRKVVNRNEIAPNGVVTIKLLDQFEATKFAIQY
jgi:hypothetical protein